MHGSFHDSMVCGNINSRKNLFYDGTGNIKFHENEKFDTLEKIQAFGLEEESIIADPKFKDIKNYDFTLEDDSPAFQIEFKPIDISDVGPRK